MGDDTLGFAVAPGRSWLARGLVILFLTPEAIILLKNYQDEAVAAGLYHRILNPITLENVRSSCSAREDCFGLTKQVDWSN